MSLSALLSEIQNSILGVIGIDKEVIKAVVIDSGGEQAWSVIAYMSNPQVILLGLLPCLLLEHFLPARNYQAHKSGSLLIDYFYPIVALVLAPAFAGFSTLSAAYIYKTHFPSLNTGLLDDQPFGVQVLGAFLITDLALYWSHRLRHEVRWLWHFHAIHHSQRHLNPATTYRGHFGDKIISSFITTIPIAFIGGSYPAWVLFAVINNFWGHFIHSNVKINLGFVGKFIVSPQYHRVHHSVLPEHFDMNYGERLVIWDWIFRSYHSDRQAYPPTGIADAKWIDEDSNNPVKLIYAYSKQQIYPFIKIASSMYTHTRALCEHLRTYGSRSS